MIDFLRGLGGIFILITPVLLPAIVGFYLLRKYRAPHERIYRMGALFTLKPIVATPIWAALILGTPSAILGLIPGIALTALIMWRFWPLFGSHRETVLKLLGWDAARYLNSALLVHASATYVGLNISALETINCLGCLGLVLPSIFAVVVFPILRD